MQNLAITIIQSDLTWENIDANLARFDVHIANINQATDLVVLPEMFSTAFSMNTSNLAESMNGKTMQWMTHHAQQLNAVVTGSLMIQENGAFYNRLIWMRPDGTYEQYDKRHLFGMGSGEDKYFRAGTERLIVELNGWKICPLICYDLRFPVWARNTVDYDVLIYTANWPEPRSFHWKTLLQARAIENQAYVLGINRVGLDKSGNLHSGDSCVVNPYGMIEFQQAYQEVVFTTILSKLYLKTTRRKLPFLQDRD